LSSGRRREPPTGLRYRKLIVTLGHKVRHPLALEALETIGRLC